MNSGHFDPWGRPTYAVHQRVKNSVFAYNVVKKSILHFIFILHFFYFTYLNDSDPNYNIRKLYTESIENAVSKHLFILVQN